MVKKIILEEAFNLPEWAEMSSYQAALFTQDGDGAAHARRLVDIHEERLKKMDEFGVDYCILSLTAPGIQTMANRPEAERNATLANDWVAREVQKNPKRFGAFCTLSMHDPKQAAQELRRCVKTHGMLGALINDHQSTGSDGEGLIFYDGPEWDVFWATVTELDVPFYLHPVAPVGQQFDKYWKARSALVGPCLSFANGVSLHLLGMIINGVFDRHPKLKVIIGHLGEKIPIDLWRIDHWLEDVHKPRGAVKMKRKIREYFASNIWVTTSGDFNTKVLNYVISELGVDRIMFSADYPYEKIDHACQWFDSLKPGPELSSQDIEKIARGTAIDVCKIRHL